MTQPFEITAATNTVNLDDHRAGIATFTVRNLTRRRIRAVARIAMPTPDSPALSWVGILPLTEAGVPAATDVRDFGVDSTQQYRVQVSAPSIAPPGSYTFTLVVADEFNPDEDFTQSPDVTFTLPEPASPKPRSLPRWLIPLILAVVLVVVVAIALLAAGTGEPGQATEATQTALEAARRTADAETAQANLIAGTQTALAAASQTAAAQTAAARTATAQAAFNAATQTAAAADQRTAIAEQRTAAAIARLTELAEFDPCLINPRLPQCRLDNVQPP